MRFSPEAQGPKLVSDRDAVGAKQGRIPVNRVPFGYRITEDGAPAVDEEHARVVRRIFRQYVHEGMGGLAIAQR